MEDAYEQPQESKVSEATRRAIEKETTSYSSSNVFDKQPSRFSSNHTFNGQDDGGTNFGGMDRDRFEAKNSYGVPAGQRTQSTSNMQSSTDTEDKVQKVSPPRRKAYRDEKPEKPGKWSRKDVSSSDSSSSYKQQNASISNTRSVGSGQNEPSSPPPDENIDELLQVSLGSPFTSHLVGYPH